MSDEAIIAQVSAILEGWTPTPGKALANRVGDNWLIGGFIDGTCFYKHTGLAPDGPDTPDDPIEAAHWLVAHVAALRGPTSQPEESPATGGVFDSGPALQEIREAYEDSHTDNEGADDVGLAEHTGADLSGDGGEHGEAGSDVDPGGDSDSGGDYSAEPLAGDIEPSEEHQTEDVSPPNFGGVLVSGDPLKAAKNDAREELARKQRAILDQFPWQDNLLEFDKLQGIRWGIAEGSHPPFNDEQQAEFDALSTFASWFGRVNQNAFNITVQIDDAETVEAVQAIDIHSGWPE